MSGRCGVLQQGVLKPPSCPSLFPSLPPYHSLVLGLQKQAAARLEPTLLQPHLFVERDGRGGGSRGGGGGRVGTGAVEGTEADIFLGNAACFQPRFLLNEWVFVVVVVVLSVCVLFSFLPSLPPFLPSFLLSSSLNLSHNTPPSLPPSLSPSLPAYPPSRLLHLCHCCGFGEGHPHSLLPPLLWS